MTSAAENTGPNPASAVSSAIATAGLSAAAVQSVGAPQSVGASGAAVGSGAMSPQAAAVAQQVAPSLARMAGRGEGVHRLTLRLHPQDLGEVRVTLTVRNGTVDVTLAAGPAAGHALREGSPHLRALLELAGASAGHVVVKELHGSTTGSAASGSTFSQGTGSDLHERNAEGGRGGNRDGSPQHLDGHSDGSGHHTGSGQPRSSGNQDGSGGPGQPNVSGHPGSAEHSGRTLRGRPQQAPLGATPTSQTPTSQTATSPASYGPAPTSLDLTL